MSTVSEKLHRWCVQELNFASESGLTNRIPDIESFRSVTKGKYKRVWTYVINHVRSQSAVDKIKRTLYFRKLVKVSEEKVVSFKDDSPGVEKLQAAVSKAKEKRAYLMQTSSRIKERILNLEQTVQNTKDEVFQFNQKTALLEFLQQQYDEKNVNLKQLLYRISHFKNTLTAYQSPKVCDEVFTPLPCDILYNNKVFDENYVFVKDLINTCCSIFKNDSHQENGDILIENVQNNLFKLRKNGFLLTDFIILFQEMSNSDFQQFTSTTKKCLSVEDFMLDKMHNRASKTLMTQLKSDNVYNSLSSIQNKKEIEKLLIAKNKAFEGSMKMSEKELNDSDFEVKCTLIEKLAENSALIESNTYLEDYLNSMSNETQLVLKRIHQQKSDSEELSPVIQTFHNVADLTFYLLYTNPDTIQKILESLNSLQTFAHKELFDLQFPSKTSIRELKSYSFNDRKLTWEYCDKTNIIQPLFPEPCATNIITSSEVQKSLNVEPYQNIRTLCENWAQFKQKLRAELIAQSEVYVENNDVNVSELYIKIIQMLDKMKFSIEKAMVSIDSGMRFCHRSKSLISEWWEQNAQYIPHIEYEGKTLKMWIDILSVLSDFEHQNYI